jgi:hypothetical protein
MPATGAADPAAEHAAADRVGAWESYRAWCTVIGARARGPTVDHGSDGPRTSAASWQSGLEVHGLPNVAVTPLQALGSTSAPASGRSASPLSRPPDMSASAVVPPVADT